MEQVAVPVDWSESATRITVHACAEERKDALVEVSALSGQSWRFLLPQGTVGAELKDRVAAASTIPVVEFDLICNGAAVDDCEVLVNDELIASAPLLTQVQLVRRTKILHALSCSF